MSVRALKLFDAHCHLQDNRISHALPQLIQTSMHSGVKHFAVNGVSEEDWHLVKQMGEEYPSVIPCFGVHPWYVAGRSSTWMESLRGFFDSTPSAAVGEIGLDKGSQGKKVHFRDQVQVFQQQLELAKELEKPASIHCVRAYGDLLDIMKSIGPFPAGVILHSFLGSAEIVPDLTRLGAYFSFSGFLMSMKAQKAKKMLALVPMDRILLETDAPDALPRSNVDQLLWIPGDTSILAEHHDDSSTSDSNHVPTDPPTLSKETLNHPANIVAVLSHVSSLLGISEEELAEVSYRNASRLFSFPGSKIFQED